MTIVKVYNFDGSITLSYEIICPKCKSKNIFEVDLVKALSGVFCSFCGAKLKTIE